MTVVYDMADGSIRSDEAQQERDSDRHEIDSHTALETVLPELQLVETSSAPRDDSIHLIRSLLGIR